MRGRRAGRRALAKDRPRRASTRATGRGSSRATVRCPSRSSPTSGPFSTRTRACSFGASAAEPGSAQAGDARACFGQGLVDLLERIAALGGLFGLGVGRAQLVGEAVPVGAGCEQLGAGLVALARALGQLRREPRGRDAGFVRFGSGLRRCLRGHRGLVFLLAQLAREARALGEGGVPVCFEQLRFGDEVARGVGSLLHFRGEPLGLDALLAGFVGRFAEGGERSVEVGLEARVGVGGAREIGGQLAGEVGDLLDRGCAALQGSRWGRFGYSSKFSFWFWRAFWGWFVFWCGFEFWFGFLDWEGLDDWGDWGFELVFPSESHAGADLGDVFFEAALHRLLSTALRRTCSPTRSRTSSSTAWMSWAPLLSAS